MTYNPEIHHRRSIRLKAYDYSQTGAYFITACAKDHVCLFGDVEQAEMILNEYGNVVTKCWNELMNHYVGLTLDAFVVMPNHIHGIIKISNVGAQFIATSYVDCPASRRSAINQKNDPGVMNQGVMNHAPTTIGDIVRAFKARCTYMINQIRNTPGVPVWQRNYYEHIIKDEKELQLIREYIVNNPMQWELDTENPQNMKGTRLRNA